jgi:hypothetical protein
MIGKRAPPFTSRCRRRAFASGELPGRALGKGDIVFAIGKLLSFCLTGKVSQEMAVLAVLAVLAIGSG